MPINSSIEKYFKIPIIPCRLYIVFYFKIHENILSASSRIKGITAKVLLLTIYFSVFTELGMHLVKWKNVECAVVLTLLVFVLILNQTTELD